MTDQKRTIFRPEAIRHYNAKREKSVLLKLIAPRTFYAVWVLAGLVLIGSALVCAVEIPTFTKAVGIIVKAHDADQQVPPRMLVLLPPAVLPTLEVGQSVFYRWEPGGEIVVRQILAVEPGVMSPRELRQRYALQPDEAPGVGAPVAVAVVATGPPPGGADPSKYLGSSYEVHVANGTRRLVSFYK